MLKFLEKLIFLLVGTIIVSCNNEEKAKIGFMIPDFAVARYKIDNEYFSKFCNAEGYEVLVADAKNSEQTQIQQAKSLLDQGVSVLVIVAVNQITAAEIVRDAHARNVKVLAYSRMIKNADLDYFIGLDESYIGVEMAQYALERIPEGNYVIINGDKRDYSAVLCEKGQMKVLQPAIQSGKIKILYNCFVEDWSPDEAYHVVSLVMNLSQEPINAILSGNDGMAHSVIKLLEDNSIKEKVLITGLDAELQACRNILQGKQSMTVYIPFKQLATKAAEIAVKLAKKEVVKNDTIIFNNRFRIPASMLHTISVDQTNMKSTIIEDGLYKESEIYD